jgi:methyl-accepting chemotaxis protein
LAGIGTAAEPGAVNRAMGASDEPLNALLSASARAFEQRDQAVGELDHCAKALGELTQLARQARELGRHTRLVAFNASIEASREGAGDSGNQAVAQEMRLLASRMGETADGMHRIVSSLGQRLQDLRHVATAEQGSPDELRMELELRAREALHAMLAAVGASLSSSSSLRDASTALRQHLDEAFVHFQFGDRVSQMLSIVGNDMNNFVDWVSHSPGATTDDAMEWLQRLESSYTMEEQRSEHHGNVHVDRGSEVEFF